MEQDLTNQVVLVTGSARRVGKAILMAFARAGARVVIHHSQSDAAAQATAEEVLALGREAIIVKGDHAQHEVIAQNFADIISHYGRLDILVNSAGVFPIGNILDVPPEEWQQTVALNLSAPFWCTQHAGRIMRDMGIHGSIINIGDNAGLRPWAKRPHHSITKAAVVMLTEVSAKSLGKYGIRVNCIVPGPVLAPDGMEPSFWDSITAQLPLARSGEPDEVAQTAIFLAKNTFITGAVLRVDGGEYLGVYE